MVDLVARLRTLELRKPPSIGETLDWARTMLLLGRRELDPETVQETLGVLLKHEEDRGRAEEALAAR